MAEEKTHNEAEANAPSTVEQKAPEVAEANAPSTSEPVATSIPTANAPDPEAASSEANPNATGAAATKRSPKAADGDAPAPKAKKEKPPALEDKPFPEFIEQHFMPALQSGLEQQGVPNCELKFVKRKINVVGYAQAPECWQVVGHWGLSGGQSRDFSLYFFDENINGQKGFSYAESGGRASTLESFRIDERKADLGLLVFWTLQRLNAQKWLVRN